MSQYELDLIEIDDPSMPRQQVANLPTDAFEELGDDDLFAELGDEFVELMPDQELGYLSVENNASQAGVIQAVLEEYGPDFLRQYGVKVVPAKQGGLYVVSSGNEALGQLVMSSKERVNLLVDRDLQFYESEAVVEGNRVLQQVTRQFADDAQDGVSYLVKVTRLMDGLMGVPKENLPTVPVATFYTAESSVVLEDERFKGYLQQRALRGKGPLTLVQQKGRRGSAEVLEAVRAGVTLDKMLREGAPMQDLAREIKAMEYSPANVLAKYGN